MRKEELEEIVKRADQVAQALGGQPETREFVSHVLGFVKHILPMVGELQASIALTSEKLPTASRQLDKVTEANFLASTEILDTVDRILNQVVGLQQWVDAQLGDANVPRLDALVRKITGGQTDAGTVAELEEAWRAFLGGRATPGSVEEQSARCQQIQSDCTNIMIALQVQDITAQQIAGVNKLMQSVDDGLHDLLHQIHGDERDGRNNEYSHHHLDIVHDATAEYTGGAERQEMADRLMRGDTETSGS